MTPVVPLLRLYLLFLNVFETFKVLKPPRRSPRTGEPTPRATSQRKRDMKGCMTIWLLWCSCAVIEGVSDTTVGLVMPFYNEIKATVYLFQIFTRARGAEPIYLHVMRPMVKPYVATLDYALELAHTIGDFVALLVSIPVGFVTSWWRPSAGASESSSPSTPSEDVAMEPVACAPEVPVDNKTRAAREPPNGSVVGTRTRGTRQASDGFVGGIAPARTSRIAKSNGIPHSKSDASVAQNQKIWHPPANVRDDDEENKRPQANRRVVSDSAASSAGVSSASSIPLVQTPSELGEITMVGEIEEWRQYPPFPSAYPTTPQVRPRSINTVPSDRCRSNLEPVCESAKPARYSSSTLPSSREPRSKTAAPPNQTLPSRIGRRKLHSEDEVVKVQDFGLSPEQLRV